jgi:DNA-binding LytR/AlgR family response regulator
MKILYKGSKEDKNKIEKDLRNGDFEFVLNEADFQMSSVNKESVSLIGKRDSKFFILLHSDIMIAESFDHDIVCYTKDGRYTVDEKLYEIHGLFEAYGFVRIHKSYVINKKHIDSIIPELNRKFTLIMANGMKVEVSRRYFIDFKEAIGMKVKL